jgi:membrane-associated protease RseP (regulator of RpoE activity)
MSKSFKAKDAEQLKKIAPQWYNLWSTTGAGTGQMTLRTNGGQITLRGGALVINRGIPGGGFIMQPPGVVQLPGGVMQLPGGVVQLQVGGGAMPSDDLVQLRQNINDEIARSKLTADQSKAVLDQLARVQTAHDDVGAGGDPAKENEQYLNNCDALRKQLANAGLSDPGTLLPPPANSRLGVTVSNASDLPGAGVAVGSVIDGSRAQKIGLIANDIIKTMNDQPINDITDLRKIVMASKQLSLIVIRNGQEVTLREAAAAATQPAK